MPYKYCVRYVCVNSLDKSVLSVLAVCVCVECWLRLNQGLSAITGRKFKRKKIDPVTYSEVVFIRPYYSRLGKNFRFRN